MGGKPLEGEQGEAVGEGWPRPAERHQEGGQSAQCQRRCPPAADHPEHLLQVAERGPLGSGHDNGEEQQGGADEGEALVALPPHPEQVGPGHLRPGQQGDDVPEVLRVVDQAPGDGRVAEVPDDPGDYQHRHVEDADQERDADEQAAEARAVLQAQPPVPGEQGDADPDKRLHQVVVEVGVAAEQVGQRPLGEPVGQGDRRQDDQRVAKGLLAVVGPLPEAVDPVPEALPCREPSCPRFGAAGLCRAFGACHFYRSSAALRPLGAVPIFPGRTFRRPLPLGSPGITTQVAQLPPPRWSCQDLPGSLLIASTIGAGEA